MSCVHYKFSSKLNYDTVTFDGLHITVSELKKQIMGRERLKASDCDLQITNAQTKEEYTDDAALIPKNSSVIIRRIPIGGVKAASKTFVIDRSEHSGGSSKAVDDVPSITLAQLSKTANLAEANASEEDKIRAMMSQSNHDYDPIHYTKKLVGPPPPNYTCFRCGKTGHYIRNCPTNGDKSFEAPQRIKRSTGIPRSFMMEVDDPSTKGAMLTNTGTYAIPTIDAEAYAVGKKEKPPFVPQDRSSSSDEDDPVPDELLCLICKDLMTDAVVIPCCGNSYCDDCIRTSLLESEEHICPTCSQAEVSPDALIANKFLRQAVNNFRNETGYTKRMRKSAAQPSGPAQKSQPRLLRPVQPLKPINSRQQDPLRANTPPQVATAAAPIPPPATPASQPPASTTPPACATPPRSETPPAAVTPSATPPGDETSSVAERNDTPPPGPPTPPPRHREDDEATPRAPKILGASSVLSDSLLPTPVITKGHHVPVLNHPPSHVHPSHSIPHPRSGPQRPNAPRAPPCRPSWEQSSARSRHQRAPAPPVQPLPVAPNLYPPNLFPPPQHGLAHPPGVAPPAYTLPYPQGQPAAPPFNMPPPGFPPTPASVPNPWVPPGPQPPIANPPIPAVPQSHFLSEEEFYRKQRRLKEEEKSKLDEFTNDFAKELLEYRKIQKDRRRSYSRSKSPYRSPYSGSSYSYSKSRSRSRTPRSYSRSVSRSRSRSRSYTPYSRRGGRGRSYRSRSRSPAYRRSRTRSPSYRGREGAGVSGAIYRSRSRSPIYRTHSPAKKLLPPGPPPEDRKYPVPRYREAPVYDAKAYYGHALDESDPFERERYLKWEREYREWYDKYYKSYSAQQSAQQNAQLRGRGPAKAYSPERFPPPRPRENSPYSRGRREDYPAQPRARAHVYPERYGAPAARAVSKDPPKNIKELEPKSLKPKKHRKKRKGEDGYGHSDSTDEARRDAKGDAATMNASRDDATPVRDEPMEGVSYKSSSDKDKKDRSKVRRKVESATSKEAPTSKSTKSTKDKDTPPVRDRTAPGEPPIKRIKEDPAQKPDDGRHAPPRKPVQSRSVRPKDEAKVEPKVKRESAKDEAKVEPKVKRESTKEEAKVEPKVKRESAKDEAKVEPKVKRESAKDEAKVEPKVKRESTKEEAKVEPKVKRESTKDSSKMERVARPKAEKTTIKQSDTKPDTRRRKDEKPSQAPPPATPMKSPRAEPAEASRSSPKPKTRVEGEKAVEREKVSIPSLMDIKPEPARKIKLNREMARRVESTQESATRSHAQHKTRLKVRRRVHGSDASGSTLVDYTSTSSTGGSPARRLEERAELRKTVVKTLEEYTHDSSTAAEDEIVFIQVPRSKWEKEDFDSEEDENKAPLLPPSSSAPDAERATPREPPPELRPPAKDPPAGDPEKERETERERGERAEPERRKPSSANQERGSEHGSERSSASSQPPKDRTSRKAPGRDPALDRKPEHRGRDQPDPRKPKEPIRRKDEPPPANKRVSQEPRGAERSPSGDRKKPPEGDTPRDTATPKSTQSTESKNDPDAKIKASQTRSARLPSDLTRETDESTFVPDYSESDSETSDADNNRAGPKDKPQESSPAHSPSPSGSHAHSSSPSSPGSQDSHKKKKDKKDKKEKKKEKKKHKNHKRHKKHKKHGTNESESEGGKAPKHKRKKKKSKKNKEKDKDERDDKSPQQ